MKKKALTAALLCACMTVTAFAQYRLVKAGDDLAALAAAGEKSGYLGVHLAPVGERLAKQLKLDGRKGALVLDVVENGPAAKAGLQEGDVIVGIDGKDVASDAALREHLASLKGGQQVPVEIVRDGKRQQMSVTLGERRGMLWMGQLDKERLFDEKQLQEFKLKLPHGSFKMHELPKGLWERELMQIDPGSFSFVGNRPRLGVAVLPLTDQLREYFRVDADKGVLVSSVAKDSAAERAGIRAGDVIVSVDGKDINDAGDISRTLAAKDEGTHQVQVAVVRDRSRQVLTATVERKGSEE